jgi:hypothetical protein
LEPDAFDSTRAGSDAPSPLAKIMVQ